MKTYTISHTYEDKTTREKVKATAEWLAESCIQALEEFEEAFADYNPECILTHAEVKPKGGDQA